MRLAFLLAVTLLATAVPSTPPADLPEGYAPLAETQPVLDKTLHVHLAPDVSSLSAAERKTVGLLIEVGRIFQRVHEDMRHPQATEAHERLIALDRRLGSPPATRNLLALYYASSGPVARGLDNVRRPFLPVDPPAPGGAVYPWGVKREEIDAFLASHPGEVESILHPRAAVRRREKAVLERDLAAVQRNREVASRHPGLEARLSELARSPDASAFYAVPYPVAYADELVRASGLLARAADAIASEDADFAGYLRARSQDLLLNDYTAGDSAWVTGRFENLNAQIGSYETYDDALYGVKTHFSLNVLLRDHARSDALRAATRALQSLEDSLPYDEGREHKRVRADIPVGVYDVLVDFAQSRGTNTATILPNEAAAARRYGRTILLRRNIMANPDLFENQRRAYQTAVEGGQAGDLTAEGGGHRTLWHEIGHYLGVDRTRDGRELDLALAQASSIYEELKADLAALYVVPALTEMGYYDADAGRAVRASGVRRVLLKNRPGREQVYQIMELMQFNYFLANGALAFNAGTGRLLVDYEQLHRAASSMLRDVLEIQAAGDPAAAEAYIARWTEWRDDLHERLAGAMRDAEGHRFAYVTYQLLEPANE